VALLYRLTSSPLLGPGATDRLQSPKDLAERDWRGIPNSFSVFDFLVVGSMRQIKLTHVDF